MKRVLYTYFLRDFSLASAQLLFGAPLFAPYSATQPLDKLATLDKAFHFTGTPNGEIAMRWYPLAIRSGYAEANEAAGAFIERVGRRKLILPIYAELVKTPKGLELAKQAFEKAKPGYHPITTASVEDMIAKAEAAPKQEAVPKQ